MLEIDIVLDVEFESSNMITGNCLQIGFVAIPHEVHDWEIESGEWKLETLSVCFLSQEQDTEDNVMEFWSKFPEVYQRIKSEAGPILEKMNEVKVWLNKLSRKYKIKDFVSDIGCVDFSWFRNLYLTYSTTEGDNFKLPYKSVCMDGMERVLKFFYSWEYIQSYYNSGKYPHTHYALDDAIKTAHEYLKLKSLITKFYLR